MPTCQDGVENRDKVYRFNTVKLGVSKELYTYLIIFEVVVFQTRFIKNQIHFQIKVVKFYFVDFPTTGLWLLNLLYHRRNWSTPYNAWWPASQINNFSCTYHVFFIWQHSLIVVLWSPEPLRKCKIFFTPSRAEKLENKFRFVLTLQPL